jgi:aspartate kinase
VVGVASERDTLMFEYARAEGSGLERGATQALLTLLDAHGVSGKQLHQTPDRLTLIISRENLHEEARVRHALAERFGPEVRLVDDLGAVSVVGAGINASFDNLRRGSAALEDAGVVPRAVSTSSFRVTWMIDRARIDDAVKLLHALFVVGRTDKV